MKKILLFAYLGLAIFLARSEGFRVGTTGFFHSPPAPCRQGEHPKTVKVGQITVHFYCGVSTAQQNLIVQFIGHALAVMPQDALPGAQVFAFTNLDQGVAAELQVLQGQGYWFSEQTLLAEWLDNGFLGQTFKGAAFLYVGNPAWNQDPTALASLTVLHEMHHLLQYQLVNSNRQVPTWLLEGGADDFAAREMANLDLLAPSRTGASYHCDYRLVDLQRERAGVPLACAYVEGARAVQLLLDEYGPRAYYQLLRSIGTNSSFDRAFARNYGLDLSDFFQRFDAYRRSGYTVSPRVPLPSFTPSAQP